ncbi:pseudouridine synthase [Mycotypha africana]|uniref:pseudouridine synthase n=1 Tax=Mycotypha africana TaxID=64632 RepID=UPI002300EF92|nr:pseudouridine synthase [Mycotypha africana]KAI8967561.1 pseudouridine synthase [Mycotypha africana]
MNSCFNKSYLFRPINRNSHIAVLSVKIVSGVPTNSCFIKVWDSRSLRLASSLATARQSVVSYKVDEPRKPKKKVALFLGYNGTPYQGMQINPAAHTVEGVLFKALCAAGAVSKSNSVDPKKVQLQRAARTDKGVHAACNVVSLKMIGYDDKQMINRINAALLSDPIRVWGYVETQRSFSAKNSCGSRIYEYMLPSYALKCLEPIRTLKNTKITLNPSIYHSDFIPLPSSNEELENRQETPSMRYVKLIDTEKLRSYRIDTERLERFEAALSLYKGTHNFHNYTNGKAFEDMSANRHIISVEVNGPKLISGMEWLSVKLHGNSFMIHQIRKMIAMAVLCTRANSPLTIIPKSFESTKINIPKAPSSGLLLDRPDFMAYNNLIMLRQKEGTTTKNILSFDVHQKEIEAFKEQFLYPHIVKTEIAERVFDTFLASTEPYLDTNYGYFLSGKS